MGDVVINTRVLCAPVTGVQRYASELLTRWNGQVNPIAPDRAPHGFAGHAWEQFVLPARLNGRLLFSPSNTGPLCVENQVVTIHDMAPFDWPQGFSPRFVAWYRFLLPRLAKRAKQTITVSEFVKERIIHHTNVPPNRVTVIPNGVSPRFCPETISGLDAAIASLHLPSRHYILVVGSLEPRKNLARLFHAWARAWGRIPENLWLVVAGGSGSARVFARVQFESIPPRVFLADRVDDSKLPSLYAGALGLACVSLYEGFGLPLLEAMASGTPVLAGNGSSLPEVAGDAGILVDPEDEEDIAKGILTLVENSELRQALRRRGLLRARQFSWDETARRTWRVLQTSAGS